MLITPKIKTLKCEIYLTNANDMFQQAEYYILNAKSTHSTNASHSIFLYNSFCSIVLFL